MSATKTRAALVQAVMALSGFTEANTEQDNVVFKPAASAAFWHRVHFHPGQPTAATCGSDGEDELVGFLQVDCCCRLGAGEKPATDRVALLLNLFKTGSKFTYQGQEVMVTSAGRGPGFSTEDCYKVPVTVYFLARYPRNTPT